MNQNTKNHRRAPAGSRQQLKTGRNLPSPTPPARPAGRPLRAGPGRTLRRCGLNKMSTTSKTATACRLTGGRKEDAGPGSPAGSLVVVHEVDVTERVRAISEGRTRPRTLHTVPVTEPKLVPPPAPLDWMFAEPPSRRDREAETRAARRERWLRLCREGIPEVSP